ncbi:sugar kinase [Reichenbachiella agarivorans]|uniref:Sugar kinase n=1 Tax=Reichenbachiella agarivorans TaxID=2979464 RepID=A0ABY6CPR6_9BACT|nr:sugar kinase [Reichenbachiella agarivorans]UXP31769.1 sugar kinase [Reichenbachiella agarivorans]
MKKVVTFGEVMMRLTPPGYAKISQTETLELTFGGGEANVAISLAYFDLKAFHVTQFPDNTVGKAATQFLRRHWVATPYVTYGPMDLGIYFHERGAVHRSSTVLYDRANSSFANLDPSVYNWEEIFEDADWFHWTGITPAISENTLAATKQALLAAKKMGVKVSCDLTYRDSLWKYGKTPQEALPELIELTDVLMTGTREMILFSDGTEEMEQEDLMKNFQKTFPNLEIIADKKRDSINASLNALSGMMWDGQQIYQTKELSVTHIVDRVGTGDAFCAGLIYGLLTKEGNQHALDFAIAACALKHTIEGDANMVSVADVEKLVSGDSSGRIIR